MRKYFLTLLAVLATLSQSGPGQAAEGQKLTAAQLTALARSSDSRVTATNVSVIGTGPSVTVLAEKSSTASDRDLKIDAIFLAKALIEGASGQIDKVKVLFSQPDKPGRFVLVDKKVVDDYAGGKMTPEQLLATVTLMPLEAEKAPDVAEGPLMERRLLVWRRIEKLREQGTGVQAFQTLFQKVEKSATSTDAPEAMIQNLAYLETKLSEQEGLIKQAKRAAQGRGIRTPAGQGGTQTASQQPPPQGGQGGGSHGGPAGVPAGGPQAGGRPNNLPWGQGGGAQGGPGGQQGGMPPPFPPGNGGGPPPPPF
jgi:hypothetical protein